MIRRGKGRPSKGERNIIVEVLDAIPQDGSYIRVNKLREETKMSTSTLTNALFYLYMTGTIEKKDVRLKRGHGVEYKLSVHRGLVGLNSLIKHKRDNLLQTAEDNQQKPPTHIMLSMEYVQASYLCNMLSIVDKFILDSFKLYADAEEDQKDKVFDTYWYIIKGLLKSIRDLVSLGFSDYTYSISNRARSNRFTDSLNISINKSAQILGLNENYLPDNLKKHLSGDLVEKEMDKPEMIENEYKKKIEWMEKWRTSALRDIELIYLQGMFKFDEI